MAGQGEIWKAAEELWSMKSKGTWYRPVLGTILGAPLAEFPRKEGKKLTGHARLYKILMVESAYLIWKLRCERVIQNGNSPFTKSKIIKRWLRVINNRLSLDRELSKPVYGKKALDKKKVLRTWSGVLMNESALPSDWTKENEVLVGIGTGLGMEDEGVGVG